jgi:protein mago nashi
MSRPRHVLILVIVCVSDALVAEIKRIVKESEILKYVLSYLYSAGLTADLLFREDDTKWPQKNKDGRQELEIRLGSEHISFEVGYPRPCQGIPAN